MVQGVLDHWFIRSRELHSNDPRPPFLAARTRRPRPRRRRPRRSDRRSGRCRVSTGSTSEKLRDRPGGAQAPVPRRLDRQRRQHRLAEPARPHGRAAEAGARGLVRRGGRPRPELGDRAGAADGRRVLAVADRALVEVPHRRPGPGPRLRPAGLRGRGGARAEPGVPRVVQPVPRLDGHRPRRARPDAPGARAPRVGVRVRRQALLRPGHPRRPAARRGRDHGRRHEVRHRRCALRRLLLPVPGRAAHARPGRRHLRDVRRRLPGHRRGPGRLASAQHRPARSASSTRRSTPPSRG